MNKMIWFLFLVLFIKIINWCEPEMTPYLVILVSLLLYLKISPSFMNLILLLELMTLNIVITLVFMGSVMVFGYWVVFALLVFSGTEASLGLSLLIMYSRTWGESMKISCFK